MVLDFSDFNKMVKETMLDKVDHKLLNGVFSFQVTSENVAGYFFGVLKEVCEKNDLKLEKIALWESQTSCIEVIEADFEGNVPLLNSHLKDSSVIDK